MEHSRKVPPSIVTIFPQRPSWSGWPSATVWLPFTESKEAAKRVEQIEALLMANYQLDALWTYVGHKRGIQRKTTEVPSGGVRSST